LWFEEDFKDNLIYLFISFAPPKKMNQRNGVRKSELQPKRVPATQDFMAHPFCLKFAPFPGCLPTADYIIS
jgi:hypothetical protein